MESDSEMIKFIEDSWFSDELYKLDDANDFYSVSLFAKKHLIQVEEIISLWLIGRINIYANLRSEYCKINRYLHKKENRYDKSDIGYGKDFYQHQNSPQCNVRKFIPCKKSEVREYLNFEGASVFKYCYHGYASGYWRLQRTKITHLVTGDYNLKNADDGWVSITGEVDVFGRDNKDYLLFNRDVFIGFERLYISLSDCNLLVNILNLNDDKKLKGFEPPHNRVAIVLLINSLFNIDGQVTYSNVSTLLSSNGIKIEQTTIKKILEETSEKRDKPYRSHSKHSKIASCLITIYCQEKNMTTTPAKVAQILNDLARTSSKEWSVTFTAEIVNNIMKSK
ncbi:TPA: hypothetical protein L7O51_001921 [Klebsiella pneumoniae]|nr:hypothetical protein [Klebsiella pneumoniae]